jgi:hypothetical protein
MRYVCSKQKLLEWDTLCEMQKFNLTLDVPDVSGIEDLGRIGG